MATEITSSEEPKFKSLTLKEILQALLDDKVVQFNSSIATQGHWVDIVTDRHFSLLVGGGYVFRIKPKPKVKKWRWVVHDIRNHNHLDISAGYYADMGEFRTKNMHGVWDVVQKIDSTMIEVEE